MSEVKVRDNGDSYDVVILGATQEEATALREAFSTIDTNRAYAQEVQGSLLDAFRANSVMKELHEDYKVNVRDVEPEMAEDYSGEAVEEAGDEFSAFSS